MKQTFELSWLRSYRERSDPNNQRLLLLVLNDDVNAVDAVCYPCPLTLPSAFSRTVGHR